MNDIFTKVREFISGRAFAYRETFDNPHGKIVLQDLAKFCYADQSTFSEGERNAARLDGRREVWLRIKEHLNLTDEELFDLYK